MMTSDFLLLADATSNAMLIAGIGVATWVLMRRSRRKRRSARRDPVTEHREMGKSRRQPLYDAPPEILRWQVEMHETARELKAELDSKISVLQTLVALAESAADRLETVVPARDAGNEAAAASDSGTTPGTLESLVEEARVLAGGTTRMVNDEQLAGIYRLADCGMTPEQIAGDRGHAVGEIEMLLSLRPPAKSEGR